VITAASGISANWSVYDTDGGLELFLCKTGSNRSARTPLSAPVCPEDDVTETARTVNLTDPPDASMVPERTSKKTLLLLFVLLPKISDIAWLRVETVDSSPPSTLESRIVANSNVLFPYPELRLFSKIAGILFVVIASEKANGSALNTLVTL
jgi:hypothetical protein